MSDSTCSEVYLNRFHISVNIRMEHFGYEFYNRRLIGVLFSKFHCQSKSTPFERCVVWSKYNSIPQHNIVFSWCTTDTSWWIILQSLEISHQSSASRSRH